MKSGWSSLANDRCFVGAATHGFEVTGMPTAVKIRAATLDRFPQLGRELPPVARPYLYSRAELESAQPSEESIDAVGFFALTPNQIARRLQAPTRATAKLEVIVFTEVDEAEVTWALEPLTAENVAAAMCANLYGAANGERPPTLFEQIDGGAHRASPALIGAIAADVRGYRLRLGRNAYDEAALSEHLLRLLVA
jgi:hypothetical protein